MRHLVNVFFGREDSRAGFVAQQGEFNSREIVCSLFEKLPGGGTLPMNLEKSTVMVVFSYGAVTTPEYKTRAITPHEVVFTLPQCVLLSPGKVEMQLRLYKESSLINSAIVPFKVLRSLSPSTIPGEEELEPGLLGVLAEVQQVLDEARVAENLRKRAEEERAETFEEWEKMLDDLKTSSLQVFNGKSRYDFPSVGSSAVIYKAQRERRLYQWNENNMVYETLCDSGGGGSDVSDVTIICGGNAYGTA